MATEIIVALIGCAGSAAGAFCGILVNTKLTTYRLEQLEKKWISITQSLSVLSSWKKRKQLCRNKSK